jgi:hypothetical protein
VKNENLAGLVKEDGLKFTEHFYRGLEALAFWFCVGLIFRTVILAPPMVKAILKVHQKHILVKGQHASAPYLGFTRGYCPRLRRMVYSIDRNA